MYGRMVHVVVDPLRTETLSGQQEPRQVVAYEYYPVPEGWRPQRPARYQDLYAPAAAQAMEVLGAFGLDEAYFQELPGSAYDEAPRRAGEFPVVVLSPAMSIDQQMYQFLIGPLVAAGYRVITVGATYESMCTVFPDGTFRPHAECVQQSDLTDHNWLRHLVELRRDDLTLVLDALQLRDVGLVGHSLGGAAVFEVARAEERVRAVVLLDASFDMMTLDRPLGTPLLNVRQEADSYDALRRMVREVAARAYIDAQHQLHAMLTGYWSAVRIADSLHISFCDVPWAYHAHVDWTSVNKVNTACVRAVTAFYDQFLRGQDAAYEQLLRDEGTQLGILPLREV